MKYLDEAGLAHLLERLGETYVRRDEAGARSISSAAALDAGCFEAGARSINGAEVALDADHFEADGQLHAPRVASVTLEGALLAENRDYAAVPAAPAAEPGDYACLVVGIGAYAGAAIGRWRIGAEPGDASAKNDRDGIE